MAKFILLTIDREKTIDPVQIVFMRGEEEAAAVAKGAIDAGLFKPKYNLIQNADNAEDAFDKLNMSESYYIGVGDIIMWLDGRREICLKDGWALV